MVDKFKDGFWNIDQEVNPRPVTHPSQGMTGGYEKWTSIPVGFAHFEKIMGADFDFGLWSF